MKLTSIIGFSAVVAYSFAAPSGNCKTKEFGVVTIHSGSQFQYSSVKKVDSHPHVFSVGGQEGTDVKFTLQKDCSLTDQDGKSIFIDPETGEFGEAGSNDKPSLGFSIEDGDLAYNGTQPWLACPSGKDQYSLSSKSCEGGTGIALHTV